MFGGGQSALRAAVDAHSSQPPVRRSDGYNVKHFECLEKHCAIIQYVIPELKRLKSQSNECMATHVEIQALH